MTEPNTDEVMPPGAGDRLRQWAETFPSFADCARKIGVSPQHLNMYISAQKKGGAAPEPGSRLIKRLVEAGLNINWLYSGKGEMLERADSGSPELISVMLSGDRLLLQLNVPVSRIEGMQNN